MWGCYNISKGANVEERDIDAYAVAVDKVEYV
jgi:hypothetical protein